MNGSGPSNGLYSCQATLDGLEDISQEEFPGSFDECGKSGNG